MRLFLLILLLLTCISIFAQVNKSSSICSYEATCNKRIGNFYAHTDLPQMKFYYNISLINDSLFEYISYSILPSENHYNKNVDSLRLNGKYLIKGNKIIFVSGKYFINNKGITWILKENSIIVRGYNTRRVKFKKVNIQEKNHF